MIEMVRRLLLQKFGSTAVVALLSLLAVFIAFTAAADGARGRAFSTKMPAHTHEGPRRVVAIAHDVESRG